ncbi:MAG: superoxide dismutase [Fibrobacter sp.]|nr:superoxide dismutase [Fibrobacter sp.]
MKPSGLNEISQTFPFKLPPLPYNHNALEPYISEKTLLFHYNKHHQKYIDTTNELVKGTDFEKSTLDKIILATSNDEKYRKLFNNAAQAWNHWFFWNSLKKDGGGIPQGNILDMINSSFDSYDQFVKEFADISIAQFGSGWGWVVLDGKKLKVIKTSNAENPLPHNLKPILALDVWEHAYYLDYQNKRNEFVLSVIKNLLNWDFAEYNLSLQSK